jgi:hypothetical protein
MANWAGGSAVLTTVVRAQDIFGVGIFMCLAGRLRIHVLAWTELVVVLVCCLVCVRKLKLAVVGCFWMSFVF